METKDTNYTKETFPNKWVIKNVDKDLIEPLRKLYEQSGYYEPSKVSIENIYVHYPILDFEHGTFYDIQKGYIEINSDTLRRILKMEKKIIGYKLIKPEYKQAALIICNTIANWENSLMEYDISIKQTGYINKLKKAEVFELWFEPVYEPEFTYKQEDYLYCKNNFLMTDGRAAYMQGKVYYCDANGSIVDEDGHTHWMPDGDYDGKSLSYYFRHATQEEIENSQKKILTIGTSSIKVEISKGKIVADNKTIDANSLSKLVNDMNGSKQYDLPWNVGFGSSVVIGCSSFKQGELNSVLEAYDKINNTSFALLPF